MDKPVDRFLVWAELVVGSVFVALLMVALSYSVHFAARPTVLMSANLTEDEVLE